MKVTVHIDSEDDAIATAGNLEVARILLTVSEQLRDDPMLELLEDEDRIERQLRDINGNTVGLLTIEHSD